jgi:hypothetical protein
MLDVKEYILYGQITPSYRGVNFNIDNPPLTLDIQNGIDKFKLEFLFNHTDSVLLRVTSKVEISDLSTMINIVKYHTQLLFDTVLLTTGFLSSITITSVLLPDKRFAQIDLGNVSTWHRKELIDIDIATLFRLNFEDASIKIAIADLRSAFIEAHLTALFSYRSIETIMQSFVNSSSTKEDRKKAWDNLRDNLNLSRDYFKKVETFSTANRHGKETNQTFDDRKEFIYTALVVLNRYCRFLATNKAKLDLGQYPYLNDISETLN